VVGSAEGGEPPASSGVADGHVASLDARSKKGEASASTPMAKGKNDDEAVPPRALSNDKHIRGYC
jgi:hypothetical protein